MARRPLTARSVAASTLLGVDPPRLPARTLVRTGELFGIAPGAVRTALSRMVSAGEADAHDGWYQLTGPLLARQERQIESRRAEVATWDGTWEMAVVTADSRPAAERADLRTALGQLRMAELREGVWLRPHNLADERLAAAREVRDQQCVHVTGARPHSVKAGDLWELNGWAVAAASLRGEMDELLPRLEADDPDALGPAFEVAATVLRHFQADPLLPAELLPGAWPGPDLRRDYEAFEAEFRRLHRHWVRQVS